MSGGHGGSRAGTKVLPADAFAYYAALPAKGRTYAAVARYFDVDRETVRSCAERERWGESLKLVEERARERAVEMALETLEEVTWRHLRACKSIQEKAAEAIERMPVKSFAEAVKALDLSVKLERDVRGLASRGRGGATVTIEAKLEEEKARWLVDVQDAEEVSDEQIEDSSGGPFLLEGGRGADSADPSDDGS